MLECEDGPIHIRCVAKRVLERCMPDAPHKARWIVGGRSPNAYPCPDLLEQLLY